MFHANREAAVAASILVLCIFATAGAGLAAATPASAPAPSEAGPVDLNTAGTDQLKSVPGIGDTMARRIVAWRDEHGPFRRVEDLMKVKGIGEKSLEKMRPHVTVAKKQ